jgi:alpha-beta hydrolase superfamily lysophospholipase
MNLKAFSETDMTEDLKKIDVPTLILHGDDDQIVPIAAAILIDVTVVILFFVPALMGMAQKLNWWPYKLSSRKQPENNTEQKSS